MRVTGTLREYDGFLRPLSDMTSRRCMSQGYFFRSIPRLDIWDTRRSQDCVWGIRGLPQTSSENFQPLFTKMNFLYSAICVFWACFCRVSGKKSWLSEHSEWVVHCVLPTASHVVRSCHHVFCKQFDAQSNCIDDIWGTSQAERCNLGGWLYAFARWGHCQRLELCHTVTASIMLIPEGQTLAVCHCKR
jgi:hypothetical protein